MLLKRFILSLLLISSLWIVLEKTANHYNGIILKSEKSNHLGGVKHLPHQSAFSKVIISEDLTDFGDKVFQNLQNHIDGGYCGTHFNKLLLFVQNKASVISVFYLTNHKVLHLFILFHSWKYLSF